MQRAHAEIGRPGAAGLLARERQRREVADPLVAMLTRAPQGIELGGDAKPLAVSRARALGLRRGDRQRAFDAVHNEPVAADRQRRQRDRALGDRAPVGQVAAGAIGGLDAPLDGLALFAFDARVGSDRGMSRSGATGGSPRRSTSEKGRRRRCVSSTTRVKLSRASASLAASRPSAVRSAILVSGETIVRLPAMSNHSAAIPA